MLPLGQFLSLASHMQRRDRPAARGPRRFRGVHALALPKAGRVVGSWARAVKVLCGWSEGAPPVEPTRPGAAGDCTATPRDGTAAPARRGCGSRLSLNPPSPQETPAVKGPAADVVRPQTYLSYRHCWADALWPNSLRHGRSLRLPSYSPFRTTELAGLHVSMRDRELVGGQGGPSS